MTDKPIIFSAPMIRALLDGRKTQTRRVLKPQPDPGQFFGQMTVLPEQRKVIARNACGMRQDIPLRYVPGDRLYVKEAWRTADAYDDLPPRDLGGEEAIWYEDDGKIQTWGWPETGPKGRHRHARHMPRWASRLILTVTDVRVQRVQEISEADARAEGVYKSEPTAEDEEWNRDWCEEHGHQYEPLRGVWMAPGVRQGWGATKAEMDRDQWWPNATGAFGVVWNSIHGPDAWGRNDWVAAISFDVHRCNIDQLEAV